MSTNKSSQPELLEDWISQAEAARLRNVSRQAIGKLVLQNRLRTLTVAGRVLVHRMDVEQFEPQTPGRKKKDKK